MKLMLSKCLLAAIAAMTMTAMPKMVAAGGMAGDVEESIALQSANLLPDHNSLPNGGSESGGSPPSEGDLPSTGITPTDGNPPSFGETVCRSSGERFYSTVVTDQRGASDMAGSCSDLCDTLCVGGVGIVVGPDCHCIAHRQPTIPVCRHVGNGVFKTIQTDQPQQGDIHRPCTGMCNMLCVAEMGDVEGPDCLCPPPMDCRDASIRSGPCTCPTGFTFDIMARMCVDVNECKQSPSICGDKSAVQCVNTQGSYSCQNLGDPSATRAPMDDSSIDTETPPISPTRAPTTEPTTEPTAAPTRAPTFDPTRAPTQAQYCRQQPSRFIRAFETIQTSDPLPTDVPGVCSDLCPALCISLSCTDGHEMPTGDECRCRRKRCGINQECRATTGTCTCLASHVMDEATRMCRRRTRAPTSSPTRAPTVNPTRAPTVKPSRKPTVAPTPKWADGRMCALGTTCRNCLNAAEFWIGSMSYKCGKEPCWQRGKWCSVGSAGTCQSKCCRWLSGRSTCQ